jgi:hypothetical protein
MPFLNRPDGKIAYQTYGSGFPVLLYAPGGPSDYPHFWTGAAEPAWR